MRFALCLAGGLSLLILSGCSSISKGVAEAVLQQETEDVRECEVVGRSFGGVTASVDKQALEGPEHSTKVLMIHGISKHQPGYSAQFRQGLGSALGLTSLDGDFKEIRLKDPQFKDANGNYDELGTLRVYRHANTNTGQDMLFYELTWSPITTPRKEDIAFDSSVEYSHQRASFNKSLKDFMNNTIPDVMIYLGPKKQHINAAVMQSMCWMFSGDWEILEDGVHKHCNPVTFPGKYNQAQVVEDDEFFFVTHSLGSRIIIDMVQSFSIDFAQDAYARPEVQALNDAIREKTMTIFMLANQWPLLQLAYDKPAVVDQLDAYCTPGGAHYDERVIAKSQIVAFSDPNDILSYPVPPRFARDYIDSRLCPEIANVTLNVAHVKGVFGITEFADPLTAHSGYHHDERVIHIITEGIQKENNAAIVDERCTVTEVF